MSVCIEAGGGACGKSGRNLIVSAWRRVRGARKRESEAEFAAVKVRGLSHLFWRHAEDGGTWAERAATCQSNTMPLVQGCPSLIGNQI